MTKKCELVEELSKLRLRAVYLAKWSNSAYAYNTIIKIHDVVCDVIDDIRKLPPCQNCKLGVYNKEGGCDEVK